MDTITMQSSGRQRNIVKFIDKYSRYTILQPIISQEKVAHIIRSTLTKMEEYQGRKPEQLNTDYEK